MKLLVILGGIVGLIFSITGINFTNVNVDQIINAVVGIIISILTILMGMKPNDPIPWHWLVMIVFSILLLVFASIWAFVLVLIAGIIGLIDDL